MRVQTRWLDVIALETDRYPRKSWYAVRAVITHSQGPGENSNQGPDAVSPSAGELKKTPLRSQPTSALYVYISTIAAVFRRYPSNRLRVFR